MIRRFELPLHRTMTLLFITQKLHGQDTFTVLWVRAFMKRGYTVTVICLEADPNASYDFEVHSLGKEKGTGKIAQVLEFWKLIRTLSYDRVFIHMNPVWGAVGAPYWMAKRTPVYCWYTHYKMQLGVWLLHIYGKRFFCATAQSLPMYTGSPQKVVVGHGIDLSVFPKRENRCTDPHKLLVVHRLSRSKRLELVLQAMTLLPDYTLDIYGIEAERDYAAQMKKLATDLKLDDRVHFHGTVSMASLPDVYVQHRLILNMASETIDKTMLEAMTCGCYPVTTASNALAIGIPKAPIDDTPQAIATFVKQYGEQAPIGADEMYRIVEERHSLAKLIEKMDTYIEKGV